jgi:cobalt-zinc-cadmium resistance protein CzcA
VGGDVIQKGSQAYVVRGLGLLESIEDIENILIDVRGSTPIRVKEVATVTISSKPRLGQVGLNFEDDVVQGIVIMLRGQNPSEVIHRLKEKITELNDRILPKDVQIEPFMDRTKLVNITIRTVLKNMLIGILLVSIVVFLFLYNWRVSVIVASVIPLAFLFAIIMLRIQGLPANLISMGALDFGLLLEGTLVIAEVVFVALLQKSKELGSRFRSYSKSGLIKNSAGSVGSYIFFAQLTSIVALIPIFAFQKVEGKMFSPLAFTLGYALLGSLIFSLTYVPVMCKLMLTKKPLQDKSNLITRTLTYWMSALYHHSCRFRFTTIMVFLVLFGGCLLRFMFWGTEFIPNMNEGAIYVRATLPNSVNLDESVRITKEMKAKLKQFDEIDFILTQTGRPNDGTDATGFFNIEFHAELKPKKEWQRKISKNELIRQIEDSLSVYPGIILAFSQPIQDNVEEYVAGVKSARVIKSFGTNLYELETMADESAGIIKGVRGIEDVNLFRSIGLPELQIRPQEVKMAQYAVSMADAQAVIEMAIGGKAATTFYENERTFDVMLRFEKHFRSDEQKIGEVLIPTMDGKQAPLKEIADIEFVTGPAFIYREGSSRYVGVGFSVRNRDLGSAIKEAQDLVKTRLIASLPTGIKIVWAGEFESQQRATQRLTIVVPAVLLLLLFLFYMNFGTVKDTLIAASAFPYAFIGGFISLWISGIPFGISAGIGFVILFGIIATNSILLTSTMKTLLQQNRNIEQAINEAVHIRLRALLMITLMGSVGLLPAAISTGMGSEIQKPLAIMIVGGILICLVLSITVLPQVFYYAYRSEKRFSRG